ncbi:Forkhead protein sep1, partial [Lachnellula suecica]
PESTVISLHNPIDDPTNASKSPSLDNLFTIFIADFTYSVPLTLNTPRRKQPSPAEKTHCVDLVIDPSRYYRPLQIYQDPVTSFDRAPMPSSKNSSNQKKPSPLRPLKNAATRRNIVFNPPQAGPHKQSPFKTKHQLSSSPSRAPFGNKLNMIPMPPPGEPIYNTDSIEKKQPVMSKFKTGSNTGPQKALFTTFSSSSISDKENYSQPYYPDHSTLFNDGLPSGNFSLEGLYGQKPAPKRLMDAAPIHESRPLKKTKSEEVQQGEESSEANYLPAPESFPPLHDDGSKPSHSYAQLIGMSILRAPSRRLTLAQIYKWISDTYSFYSASDAGWQNSIRHNLSLNKAFIKQERPKDDPGKGNYWAIQPGMETGFIKDKSRKSAGGNDNGPVMSALPTPTLQPELPQSSLPQQGSFKPLVPAPRPQELPPKPTYSPPEPQLPKASEELSSDATIPASDAYLELEQDEATQEAPSSPLLQSSPPAALMHSSPPIPRHVPRRQHTPPPVPRFPSSSRSRSHKRKFASMDDSGYLSSLDSSAMRPHRMLTSEADRPRMKRGRAEEEIARLRGSSYDSPTKSRACFAPPSSSPVRQSIKNRSSQMLPPLTPMVKLKAPMRPPPSVSPNTNLRMHRDKVREMVGSPLRGVTSLDENLPWSPAFNLDDNYLFQEFTHGDFDIFTDSTGFLSVPGMGSPEKKSAKRPRLDRSRSANILADISNSNYSKSITSTPLLKLTPGLSSSIFKSPSKGLGLMDSPTKLLSIDNSLSPFKLPAQSPSFNHQAFDLPHDDFLGAEFLSEELDDFSGVDIMQGFQKIGAGGASSRSTPKTNTSSRPPFGRSFTSRF